MGRRGIELRNGGGRGALNQRHVGARATDNAVYITYIITDVFTSLTSLIAHHMLILHSLRDVGNV